MKIIVFFIIILQAQILLTVQSLNIIELFQFNEIVNLVDAKHNLIEIKKVNLKK